MQPLEELELDNRRNSELKFDEDVSELSLSVLDDGSYCMGVGLFYWV